MNKLKSKFLILFVFLVLGISRCSNATIPSLKNETTTEIKPIYDQSIIIIYRNENSGAGIPVILSIDNKYIGKISIKSYYRLVVAPGRHVVRSRSDNEAVFNLLTEKGKVYFIHQKVDMGFTHDYVDLVQVGEEIGAIEIRECQQLNLP